MSTDVETELQSFVQARYLHLRRTAYLFCGDWHRAEDLVQTALARVVVAARRHRIDSLDAYARTTLTRVYLDDQRRLPGRRERSLAPADAEVFRQAGSIQRRRRTGAGLAALATLSVLTAGGLAVAGQFGAARNTPTAVLPAASGSATPTPSVGAIPPAAVLSTLRALLPAGSTTSGAASSEGFAKVVVTDAQGRSTVEVNVQPGYQAQAERAASAGKLGSNTPLGLYDCATRSVPSGAHCSATTLADGTLVVTVGGPAGEPGAPAVTMRQVDALTPADVRIVVSVWNAVNIKHGPTTRSVPGLTTGQLQAMAINGRWTTGGPGTGGGHG